MIISGNSMISLIKIEFFILIKLIKSYNSLKIKLKNNSVPINKNK